MAFLQVITRTFGQRPEMLKRNRASLDALTSKDWEQTIVEDTEGRGVSWANQNLQHVLATGDYVWVLDDDDVCALPELVEELREAVNKHLPPVVVMWAYHEKWGMLPDIEHWGKAPTLGKCGFSNFFIRSDVWNRERAMFANFACYEADYEFANHLWKQGYQFEWHDALAAWYPQQSNGAVENAQ